MNYYYYYYDSSSHAVIRVDTYTEAQVGGGETAVF